MRKFWAILVLLVYTLSATGTSVSMHFCCGKIGQLIINNEANDQEVCPLCLKSGHKKESTPFAGLANDRDCKLCNRDGKSMEHDCGDGFCDHVNGETGCKNVAVDTKDATNPHIAKYEHQEAATPFPAEAIIYWIQDLSLLPVIENKRIFTNASPPIVSKAPIFVIHCTYLI